MQTPQTRGRQSSRGQHEPRTTGPATWHGANVSLYCSFAREHLWCVHVCVCVLTVSSRRSRGKCGTPVTSPKRGSPGRVEPILCSCSSMVYHGTCSVVFFASCQKAPRSVKQSDAPNTVHPTNRRAARERKSEAEKERKTENYT